MGTDGAIQKCIAALRSRRPVLLPTDTVYGLCTSAESEEAALRVYRLKGRAETQPTALLAASVDDLLELLPELRGDSGTIVRALLPGPYTLVLPNPARRFRWLAGTRTDAIGVRVPELPEPARAVVAAVGAVLATSANDPGGPSPATLDDVPQRIRDGCGAELDLGPLPGTPSTVIDFTGSEPYVIREGIAPAAEALARVRAALSG
ncbi:MAG TPA: Sua5/YciO/YrdC/YwlC family protein [Gaiellaceae bacterium]|nr:Sua5/YciO/YrdC/YwlC family protein [Gaiellaceae bacterium]